MTKATRRSAKDKPSSSTGYSEKKAPKQPLTPFVKAPSTLQPVLELLSPKEVYLLHIDQSPIELKKQIFVVPIIINALITFLIAWRVYRGIYTYPALVVTALGLPSSMSVDTSSISWGEFAGLILRRAGTFILDYIVFTLFLAWPIRFLLGPVLWRRAVGFRDREVIVRRSQKAWSKKLVPNRWIYDDEETVTKTIVPAVTPDRVRKSGYLLVDANWDLDYDAMVRAHELVDKTKKGHGKPLDEFRTAVIVHTDDDGWLIWRVADEETDEGRKRATQRDKIVLFKDKLTAMGKESLFFRWVELIQFESTQPGGFTPERQRSAMLQAKEMFESQGVDFSQFWQEVGGMEGLPGFE